jgi:hypothetical protein
VRRAIEPVDSLAPVGNRGHVVGEYNLDLQGMAVAPLETDGQLSNQRVDCRHSCPQLEGSFDDCWVRIGTLQRSDRIAQGSKVHNLKSAVQILHVGVPAAAVERLKQCYHTLDFKFEC